MNFTVRIFGTPVGFDTYNVQTEQDLGYCQIFDDGSLEQEKFKVHYRSGCKQVTYNYLRYSCITQPGRPNAFFGISIVFQNEYCSDPMSIYDLFKFVYKTLLEKGWILNEISAKNAHAQFNIQKFSDVNAECDCIIEMLSNNIGNHLAQTICPLNIPVPRDVSKVACYAPEDADNNKILQALASCGTVSVSPNYMRANVGGSSSSGSDFEISPAAVEEIRNRCQELKNALKSWGTKVETFNQQFGVQNNLGKAHILKSDWLAILNEGRGLEEVIEKLDDTIASWLQKKRTHKQLLDVKKRVEELKVNCEQRVRNFRQYQNAFAPGAETGAGAGTETRKRAGFDTKDEHFSEILHKFIHHHKKKIAIILTVLVVGVGIILVLSLENSDDNKKVPDSNPKEESIDSKQDSNPNTVDYLSLARQCLVDADYVGAYRNCKNGGDDDYAATLQQEYKDVCLIKAKGHPEKEQWFKEEMAKVDYTPTQAELNQIKVRANSTPLPVDKSKYTIRGRDKNNNIVNEYISGRNYTFECNKGNVEVKDCTWFYDGNVIKDGMIAVKENGGHSISCKKDGKTLASAQITVKAH